MRDGSALGSVGQITGLGPTRPRLPTDGTGPATNPTADCPSGEKNRCGISPLTVAPQRLQAGRLDRNRDFQIGCEPLEVRVHSRQAANVDNSPRQRSRPRNDSPGTGPGGAFEHISSTANDTVKLLRSLDRKKDRQETGLFLAEGARHAEEALANGWSPAYAFASQQAVIDRPQTRDLLERMRKAGARVLTGSEKILATLSRRTIRRR